MEVGKSTKGRLSAGELNPNLKVTETANGITLSSRTKA
jgi:hypothetical protein